MAQVEDYDVVECSPNQEECEELERLCRKCNGIMEDFNFRTNVCLKCTPSNRGEKRKRVRFDLENELDEFCKEFNKRGKIEHGDLIFT